MEAKKLPGWMAFLTMLPVILVLTPERSSAQRAMISKDQAFEIYRETPARRNDKEWLTIKIQADAPII